MVALLAELGLPVPSELKVVFSTSGSQSNGSEDPYEACEALFPLQSSVECLCSMAFLPKT